MNAPSNRCRVLLGVLLVLCTQQGVDAQVRGVVLGEGGVPVPAALIEMWTRDERLATTTTNDSGRFVLPTQTTHVIDRLTVSHLGYRLVSLRVPDTVHELRIELELLPMPLPERTVSVMRQACPNVESGEPRDLWRAASSRYSQETAGRALRTDMLRLEEELLPEADIGWVSEERLRPAWRAWAGATPTPQHGRYIDINTRIAEAGYAFRTESSEPPWRFPSLDERDAHHFASELFGSLHTISIHHRVETDGETVLAFCPLDSRRPAIQGTLRIADDTTFVEGEWTLLTARPVRRAGGHVVFGRWRSEGDQLAHLLPERGVAWVQHPRWSDRYSQRYTVYTAWRIASDGALPSGKGAARQ